MADLAGIPGQVFSELAGVMKDAGKGVVQAGKDIAKGTAETLVTAATPSQPTSMGGEGKAQEAGQAGADPLTAMKQQNAAKARARLSQVRQELEEYYQQQKQKKKQAEAVTEEQKKMEEIQKKQSKKKQEERDVLGRLSRQYGGTGEVGKSGY